MYNQITMNEYITARKHCMTLAELVANTDDGTLINIEYELLSDVVPATGCTHEYLRNVNRLIDKGELCISPTSYRRVYVPTLAKVVHKELARRYVLMHRNCKGGQEAK